MTLPSDYRERVYAGWLGKCAGVRLGAPLENWTYDEIAQNLGEVNDYLPLPVGKIFKPDDDTAVPLILIRALEDYGASVTAEQIGETLLNYIADQRGTFWWGGYGISTEHTAYLNLAHGITAPRSGSIAQNGKILAEQIGGQIFSDVWGLVCPNDPACAADYAAKASSVTHDGEAIYGGRFIAALVSQAFSVSDPLALIECGLSLIPSQSDYARVVNAMIEFHHAQPDDWHTCYKHLAKNFGYDRYGGIVHIIPNAGVIALALLYSDGDFSQAIQIATMAGWDTDCNAGNVGCIMGVALGLEGVGLRWRTAMNDVIVAASVIGSRNVIDLPACADLFHQLGSQLHGDAVTPRARYHFDYPNSTHGFLSTARLAEVIDLRQQEGALKIVVRDLKKKGEARAYVKTSYRPNELSANYYGASFSPKIYPGQTITAKLFLPSDAPDGLLASLFVFDEYHQAFHQSLGATLKRGEWQSIAYTVPPLENVLLSQVGIVLHNTGESWSGCLLLDDLDWHGIVNFSDDFSQARHEYGAISGWTFLRGYWRLDDGAYHGSGADVSETYTGDIAWRDLTLTTDVVPIVGEQHNINVRVQGARRSYAVGFAPKDRMAIYKNIGGYQVRHESEFVWKHQQRYRLQVVAHGAELIVSVDNVEVMRWTDSRGPYLNGQIGLSTFNGSHTRYAYLQVIGQE
ncbi:MAG: ADP-ribosylglycohydrolase family protein [Chloroflexota bacterium]